MKIHKEGHQIIAVSTLILLGLAIVIHYTLQPFNAIQNILYMLEIVLLFLIIRFFRYPNRTLTADENAIYSPADGKIVIIEQKMEQKYFQEERIQISIFMSVMNVHVNFYPVSGNIVMTDYFPGDKMVAWHPKSSDLNEHACVVVEDARKRKILVKQIAGALARRIVCKAKKDEEVQQGNELGMIKFGSRVDISLPANARINVRMNQKVKAKETILAYFE
jgi:phosphatidylserine decarboxylase